METEALARETNMKSQAQDQGQKRILSTRKEITDFRNHPKYSGSKNIFKLTDTTNHSTFCCISSLPPLWLPLQMTMILGGGFLEREMQSLNAVSSESTALTRTIGAGRGGCVELAGNTHNKCPQIQGPQKFYFSRFSSTEKGRGCGYSCVRLHHGAHSWS